MDTNRFVLPRWRASIDHVTSAEAWHGSGPIEDLTAFDEEFNQDFRQYEESPNPGSLADLLATALILNRNEEVAHLASEVVAGELDVGPGPEIVAQTILERLDHTPPFEFFDVASDEDYAARIRVLKSALRRDPRNALAWIDSGLIYTILGQRPQALRSVDVALSLAPESRFILRAASRFFLHIGDLERAHRTVGDSVRLLEDPWLAAASISTALVSGAKPLRERSIKRLLDNTEPAQATELWSSLATADYVTGNDRRALRNFRQSLVVPTENSLAQAEWVSHRSPLLEVDENLLEEVRFSYEARSRHLVAAGRPKEALSYAERWMAFQPFSAEAAAFASYVASVGVKDFQRAAELARQRLHVVGGNKHWLLNNLAFALANDGALEQASAAVEKISPDVREADPHVVATRGLISYRSGQREEGRALYARALRHASSLSIETQALMALFWAREESRYADRDTGVIEKAMELSRSTRHPFVVSWRRELGFTWAVEET